MINLQGRLPKLENFKALDRAVNTFIGRDLQRHVSAKIDNLGAYERVFHPVYWDAKYHYEESINET